jgi:hypothetical protein
MSTGSTRPRSAASDRWQAFAGLRAALAAVLALCLGACATAAPPEPAAPSPGERMLIDVEILEFEPGRVEVLAEERSQIATLLGVAKVEAASSIDIRRAEARYIPVQIKRTLATSGRFGSLWVVPRRTQAVDLTLSGRIVESDGEHLSIEVEARDASGDLWIKRGYETEMTEEDYDRAAQVAGGDPAQKLYDQLMSDLAAELDKRSVRDLRKLRDIAELRFAQRFAPQAFEGYLQPVSHGDSRVELKRLPARNDPMLRRTRQLSAREQLFLDTLNGHYDALYSRLNTPYTSWRRASRSEVEAFRSLVNRARIKILGGTALLVGGIVAGTTVGGDTGLALGVLSGAGGVASIASGFSDSSKSATHASAVKELGASFDGEVEPLVISTDRTVTRLTGTADGQYEKWRQLLGDIYSAEANVGNEMQMYVETKPLDADAPSAGNAP